MEDDDDRIGQEISDQNLESKAINQHKENEETEKKESKELVVPQLSMTVVQNSVNQLNESAAEKTDEI